MVYIVELLKRYHFFYITTGLALGLILSYIILILLNKIKINKWFKKILGLLCYFFVISMVGYLCLKYTHWLFDSRHDGFAGNFIGGIIGGIVAYIIALHQSSQSKNQELIALKRSYKATIVALQSEMEYNDQLLTNILTYLTEGEHKTLKIPFRTNIWDAVVLKPEFVEKISSEEYKKISNTYTEISLFKESSTDYKTLIQLKENIKNIKQIIITKS